MAQVGEKADIAITGSQEKTDWVLCVVRNSESVYRNISDFEGSSSLKESRIQLRLVFELDGLQGRPIAIDGYTARLAQHPQALDMIPMLMRHQDARQIFRRAPNGGEAGPDLSETEPRINQDSCFIGLNVGAIPARAAAENG